MINVYDMKDHKMPKSYVIPRKWTNKTWLVKCRETDQIAICGTLIEALRTSFAMNIRGRKLNSEYSL